MKRQRTPAGLVPHHPTEEAARAEAQHQADQARHPFLIWRGARLAGASACWTVTVQERTFPACCGMRREATIYPRPLHQVHAEERES